MNKRVRLALCAATALCLTACTGASIPITEETEPAYTLPPAQMEYVAPIGDATLEYTAEAVVYFPARDGMTITPGRLSVSCSASRPHAESVLRAALDYTGDSLAAPLFGEANVQLTGANPVEVSRNVATVNLSAAALQMDRRSFYIACQAIANTLTELDDIEYVNVLVADKQIGLDLANTAPMGMFQRTLNLNAGALYEQALTRRTQGTSARLADVAAMYYPLGAVDGLMSEARSVVFTDSSPAAMVRTLLAELADCEHAGGAAMPDLSLLLAAPPDLSEATDTAQRVVDLRFSTALDEQLAQASLTRADAFAAVTYTLCTYLPNLYGVRVTVGEETVESVTLADGTLLLFSGGVQRRADYAALLMNLCSLYFADGKNQSLVAVERPVPYYLTRSPRYLLLALAHGPTASDADGAAPLLPDDALRDADILGISLRDGTLLVNFSTAFQTAVAMLEPEQARLLAYAMTNALLANPAIHRVAFFVMGTQLSTPAGELSWAGYFYSNPGLVRQPE